MVILRPSILVVLVALTISGCVVPWGMDGAGDDPPPTAVAVTSFDFTKPLLMSEQRIAGGSSVSGNNCAIIDSKYVILRGSVDLTWEPNSELTRDLRVYGAESYEHVFADSGNIPSPIHIEFENVSRENDVGEFSFIVMLGHDGIMMNQPATMALHLEIEGNEKPTVGGESCFIG